MMEDQINDVFRYAWITGLKELRRAALHLTIGWIIIVLILIVHRLIALLLDMFMVSVLSPLNFGLLLLGVMVLSKGIAHHVNGVRMVSLFPPYRGIAKLVKVCIIGGGLLVMFSVVLMISLVFVLALGGLVLFVSGLVIILVGLIGIAFFWSRVAYFEADRRYRIASILMATGIVLGTFFLAVAFYELSIRMAFEKFGLMFFTGLIVAGIPSIIAWTLIYVALKSTIISLEHQNM